MIFLGRKKLSSHRRITIRIPYDLLKNKPSNLTDSEYVRRTLDKYIKIKKEIPNGILDKLISIFIEKRVISNTITFSDEEVEFLDKKVKEILGVKDE